MNLLQPLLFSLQPKEEDLHVLLPQLLQNPFFTPKEENFTAAVADNFLQFGCIRLGVMVDQVIYKLLSTHCCKGPGARQADTLIDTALKTFYTLPSAMERFIANSKNPPPLLFGNYNIPEEPDISDEDDESSAAVFESGLTPYNLQVPSANRDHSKSSRSSGVFSNTTSSTSNLGDTVSEDEYTQPSSGPTRPRQLSGGHTDHFSARGRAESMKHLTGRRKDSIFQGPPIGLFEPSRRTSSEASITSSTASLKVLQDSSVWHASLPSPGDMIIGSYGDDSTYPILMWNPSLNVMFKVGGRSGLSSGTLVVDNPKELLKLKVVNTTNQKIAFSIRSYRQSLMFRSHVIFPKAGLDLLEPQQESSIDVELMGAGEGETNEYICIDLLVCQLNCTPSWNVHRRYVVLKRRYILIYPHLCVLKIPHIFFCRQDQHKFIKKISRNEQIILPGSIVTQKVS